MNGFGATDVGRTRERNEDSFLLIPPYICAVADGMGGHQGGQEASRIAIEMVEEKVKFGDLPAKGQYESWLAETVELANGRIFLKSQAQKELSGMGTTLSVAYFHEDRMYWAHVGDCRIYLYRNGTLKQVSKDHVLTSAERKKSHILTRALGINESIIVDTGATPIFPQDQILLCSDGLHDVIGVKELVVILEKSGFASEEKVKKMIASANDAGGPDNITAVLVSVE